MAKFRQIHSRMWSADQWFAELKPGLKLLFVYLFSNERATIGGLYELPLRFISFETGLDKEAVAQGMKEFERDGKIAYDYETSVIWVKNMHKYQCQKNPSENVVKGIRDDIGKVPNCALKEQWIEAHRVLVGYGDGTSTVPIVSSSDVSSEEGVQGEEQTAAPEIQDAIVRGRKTMDGVLAFAAKAKYPGREKIPEPYAEYADVYHELTGQTPRAGTVLDWISEFGVWQAAGVQPQDVRDADARLKKMPDFVPTSPHGYTKTAIAIHDKRHVQPAGPQSELDKALKLIGANNG